MTAATDTATPPSRTCDECGRRVPESESIVLHNIVVCAECKPAVVGRLQTGQKIRKPAPRFSIKQFLHAVFVEGGRFWEHRGRLIYNGAQLLLTAVFAAIRWRQAHFFIDNIGTYITVAVISNILYCACYFPEAVLQIPLLRGFKQPLRWCVLIGGTLFACSLAGILLDNAIFTAPSDAD